jgi:hypothetical protein
VAAGLICSLGPGQGSLTGVANRWLWIGGLTAAVLAVGGVAYAASSSPPAALNPGPTPAPTPAPSPAPTPTPAPAPGPPTTPQVPAPSGSIPTPPFTDPVPAVPEILGAMQGMLAALIGAGYVPNAPPYTSADVDTNPNNPKFVAALAALQASIYAGGNHIVTGGVADWASYALVLFAYAVEFGHITGSSLVTDPTMIGMAQKALLWQRKVAVTSFAADGTLSQDFASAVRIFQANMIASDSQLAAMRTDGQLDYFTFAGILIQAYVVP